MPTLKLALLHFAVRHKQPQENRRELLNLFRQAGEAGAQIILSPEMALSGYCFSSREDIAPCTETAAGPTLSALAEISRQYRCFSCLGMAEREPGTGLFYNSAFVIGPLGERLLRYRKIAAEKRWARPGDPCLDNTFPTPWGRVGVLICADSYHSLPARITSLRGADLLLLPVNWPPTGLDPRLLWRARSVENKIVTAICNRTGMDPAMDFNQAVSAVYDSQGRTLLEAVGQQSAFHLVDIPLNKEKRLESGPRITRMHSRMLSDISACSLNMTGLGDLTAYLCLPEPGPLELTCIPGDNEQTLVDALTQPCEKDKADIRVSILPAMRYQPTVLSSIEQLARNQDRAILLSRPGAEGLELWWFTREKAPSRWLWRTGSGLSPFALPCVAWGPAKILLAPPLALEHPEMVLAGAKKGCDIVLISAPNLSEEIRLLAGARSIDQLVVAVSGRDMAGVWMPPRGHQPWSESMATAGGCCSVRLDTCNTRCKQLPDRIDYEMLMAGSQKSPWDLNQGEIREANEVSINKYRGRG